MKLFHSSYYVIIPWLDRLFHNQWQTKSAVSQMLVWDFFFCLVYDLHAWWTLFFVLFNETNFTDFISLEFRWCDTISGWCYTKIWWDFMKFSEDRLVILLNTICGQEFWKRLVAQFTYRAMLRSLFTAILNEIWQISRNANRHYFHKKISTKSQNIVTRAKNIKTRK